MSAEGTDSSSDIYNDSSNTAIIVVYVLFSSFSITINLFAVISIARCCPICIYTLLVCFLSAIELLNAFACAATTLYSYLATNDNFENSSVLCNFYALLYVAFRIMATLIVSFLVFDRVFLSLRPQYYVKKWASFRTRWIVPFSICVVAAALASVPFVTSSYATSPDGGRFHCLFSYTGSFAMFYIVFHLVQTLATLVAIPWVISREESVDARLSVLLVGEMVVCRQGKNVVKVRDGLKFSRLVGALVVLYHACSALLPLLLLLRFLDVDYPAVVGLLALQLPTFGAMFIPVVYGFSWQPYRRAYYASVSRLCPPTSAEVKARRIRSIYNPAFRDTRDYDANSILHTRGIALNDQDIDQLDISSTVPSSSAPSDPVELDPNQLTTHAEPDSSRRRPGSSRRRPEHLPRAKSFQDRHYYTPSKFQSIFEIIDALSDPHRHASDETSDLSDNSDSRDSLDSLGSSSSPTALQLNDVCLQVEADRADPLHGINFSSVSVSSWPSNNKVINKSRLYSEQRPTSFKHFRPKEVYNKKHEESSPPGPIRFTDLKKTRPEKTGNELGQTNGDRFTRYLANESYISSNNE